MAIYMQLPNIQGSVSTKEYQGWIELANIDFSAKRAINLKIGQQTDRESGIPRINDMSISKNIDKSSPYLLEALLSGTSMGKVTIVVCKSGNTAKVSSEYTLYNAMVSYFEQQVDGTSEQGGQDYLSLNFTKIEQRYIPYNDRGNAEAAIASGYDLSTATVS